MCVCVCVCVCVCTYMCTSGCNQPFLYPLQLERLAKRLKKEKVNVDVVIFGEQEFNEEVLTPFINIINGKEGTK